VLEIDRWRHRIALSLKSVPVTVMNVEATPVLTGVE